MGQEISCAVFSRDDYTEFKRRLAHETERLRDYFADNAFDYPKTHFGVELEGCLIDKQSNPAPKSDKLLSQLNDNKIVPELAKYNFEINTRPIEFHHSCLEEMALELELYWQACETEAKKIDALPVFIGILPTLTEQMLCEENIYPYQRYYALEAELSKYRKGQPIETDIQGIEHLAQRFQNVMLESVTTSYQIHVQVNQQNAVRLYNASHILSAPMIALSANSPFLLGKDLWCDSRIPVFEQSAAVPMDINGKPTKYERVTFGHKYAKESLLEVFLENLADYLVLLPELSDKPISELHHLRLHNGAIWRWNRPLIGMDNPDKPNLRIEHRVNPAGPTIPDMIANTALFVGALQYYADLKEAPEDALSFQDAKANFYHAAKDGLSSNITWMGKKEVPMCKLISEQLIPAAQKGLRKLGVDPEASEAYLNIIEQRVKTRQTGSQWQRDFIETHGRDFNRMLEQYYQNQLKQNAVHEWKI